MAFIYAVRCNFTRPDLEEAWNAWYNGPKLAKMLSKPLFRTGQRFIATGLETRRKYLALWCVDSPDAFTTPEYKSDWGFFEWTPYITDWSRDLYALPAEVDPESFAIGEGEAVFLASFEDLSEADAEAARQIAAPQRPGVTWLNAVGLDKHSPRLGLRRLADPAYNPAPVSGAIGYNESVFTPICPCGRA